jgi:general nucleoside transport system permease protein
MTTTEEKPSPVGRAIESVREGGTVVITVLAFVCAMIVGAVLIVIADEPTRAAMGYFFAYPWDAFAAGWEAVSSAYLALF